MNLLPGWNDRLKEFRDTELPALIRTTLPRSPHYFSHQVNFVVREREAEAMADLAEQRPLAWIGLDSECQYSRPPLAVVRNRLVFDIRSIRPLLLSLAMVDSTGGDDPLIHRFVVDLRRSEVLRAIRQILSSPCIFVAYHAQSELFCLWQLGLPEPRATWDSWICEKALTLGRTHKRYFMRSNSGDQELEDALATDEAQLQEDSRLALVPTCHRYRVPYAFATSKERLQRSFLDHPEGAPFTTEQIEYAVADAVAVAQLYPYQLQAAALGGILDHLQRIEMDWGTTNARMMWHGALVDKEEQARLRNACDRHLAELKPKLAEQGVDNVKSHSQLKAYFGRHGLLELFRRGDSYSFDRDQLSQFKARHPAIHLIRSARRVLDLREGSFLTDEFIGVDGRFHPEYRHLGTHTGRQSSRSPNVLGLGRIFRPLIVAPAGRGIGEVDLSQIEVGIAAAVYNDDELVTMFNSGDVYAAMAQRFSCGLPEEDLKLSSREFKDKHTELRDQMKICTLGIIYGLTPHGIAGQLGISYFKASLLQQQFMRMFPALERALDRTACVGEMRGYATTSTGLRRYRANNSGTLSNWERNWMTNHPVQGTAAALFKVAGNRLDRLYERHGAHLILAVHDAYVFEAPLESLDEVANLTDRVLRESVEEHFPQLQPRTEINIRHPDCWNKDGHADSIDRWIADPMFTL
jgi:DNA polymerase-1